MSILRVNVCWGKETLFRLPAFPAENSPCCLTLHTHLLIFYRLAAQQLIHSHQAPHYKQFTIISLRTIHQCCMISMFWQGHGISPVLPYKATFISFWPIRELVGDGIKAIPPDFMVRWSLVFSSPKQCSLVVCLVSLLFHSF